MQPSLGSETGSVGHVLDVIRRAGGLTRAEIIERTGLSRTTVASRLDALQGAGYISSGQSTSARGRPPSHFLFREDQGALLIADAGATGVQVAVTDLGGHIRCDLRASLDITIGPDAWLQSVGALFDQLLEKAGLTKESVRGIGLAVPCPVVVDNDANAKALGEHAGEFADRDSLVMVKVATGIGAGIIAHGTIYRGADGAAGDIGHIQIDPRDDGLGTGDPPICRCGNVGCLEAYAGGWALLRDLRNAGRDASAIPDVVGLIVAGDALAVNLARRAGRFIGRTLSEVVSLLNPSVVVIGGELAAGSDYVIAGIRESVYARSSPLATRTLQIVPARLGDRAGTVGLTSVLTDYLFDPPRVDAAFS
jgi:predicted NBD/HSP70 family sugar kinase